MPPAAAPADGAARPTPSCLRALHGPTMGHRLRCPLLAPHAVYRGLWHLLLYTTALLTTPPEAQRADFRFASAMRLRANTRRSRRSGWVGELASTSVFGPAASALPTTDLHLLLELRSRSVLVLLCLQKIHNLQQSVSCPRAAAVQWAPLPHPMQRT